MSQIRRDRRQSVVSLAVIAVMLGSGDWSYTTLGWGFRPLSGILGTVISVVASLVLFDTWFYWLHRLLHTRFFIGESPYVDLRNNLAGGFTYR